MRQFSLQSVVTICCIFFLLGCGNQRTGPGYSMRFPEVTATPAPSQAALLFHEVAISPHESLANDKLIAAVTAAEQPLFLAFAQSGLWMGVSDANGNYSWSRPAALPEALTSDAIRALGIYKDELWVGTYNQGLFRLALSADNPEWQNATTENSALPSNTVNRISQQAVMTAKGAVIPSLESEAWISFSSEDGLTDENTLDMGGWSTYAGGGTVVATASGVEMLMVGADTKFERLSGDSRCHFEHASRLYTVASNLWVLIDQKDSTSPSGWRVAGICEGGARLTGLQWNPVNLDGVAYPNAPIATHYQENDGRVWIAFSADATHPQGTLASYLNGKWTRYQLPAEMPAIANDALMLRVGNDLWVEKAGEMAFGVLENIIVNP